ncbi:MAG TPA: hypothetical protein VEK06_04960 [Myxococcota bacterium]|nr:hypothetical protein [Myxococcota bacterium]
MSQYLALLALAITTFLPTAVVHAQCIESLLKLDVCSVKECQLRHSKVHPTCDVPRTCDPKKARGLSKNELQRRLDLNSNCKMVRQAVAECFKEAHGTHEEEIKKAQVGINECSYQAGRQR